MALAIDSSTPAILGQAGSTSITSNSFSPPANSLLAIGIVHDGFASLSSFAMTDSLGTHLTYTEAVSTTLSSNHLYVQIWTAPVGGTAPGSMTVKQTWTGTTSYNDIICVLVFTGAASSQTGAAHNTATSSSGTPSVGVTTTANGSYVIVMVGDWTNETNPTIPSGQTDSFNSHTMDYVGTQGGCNAWMQSTTSPTPTSGTLVTINDTAPTAIAYAMAGLEILAAATANPAWVPVSVPLRRFTLRRVKNTTSFFIPDTTLWVPPGVRSRPRVARIARQNIRNWNPPQFNPPIVVPHVGQWGRRYPWQRRGKAADAVWPSQTPPVAPQWVPGRPARARQLAALRRGTRAVVIGGNHVDIAPLTHSIRRQPTLKRYSRTTRAIGVHSEYISLTKPARRPVPLRKYGRFTMPIPPQFNPPFVAPPTRQAGRRYALLRRSFIGLPPMPQGSSPVVPKPPCVAFPTEAVFDAYADFAVFDTYRSFAAFDAYSGDVVIDPYSASAVFDLYQAYAQFDPYISTAVFDAYSASAFLAAACP